jgi:hypothetical protein
MKKGSKSIIINEKKQLYRIIKLINRKSPIGSGIVKVLEFKPGNPNETEVVLQHKKPLKKLIIYNEKFYGEDCGEFKSQAEIINWILEQI